MLRKESVWLRIWGVALLWILMFAHPAFPDIVREPRIEFEHVALDEGLLRNTISSIVQDQLGFLWIGTADGLFRYDGYQFKAYLHDPDNPRSVSHNRITTLYEDRDGVLWIGTNGGGLNAFSRETEQFQTYQPDSNAPDSISHHTITSIFEDRAGLLWIGTNGGGLNVYQREAGQFLHYVHDDNDPGSISSNFIRAIYEDRLGDLWIGTLAGGLNRFVRDAGKFIHYRHDPDNPFSLSHNAVFAILEDRTGNFWVGTSGGGLNRFDRDAQQFTTYLPEAENPSSISHEKISTLFEDQAGVLWVGTDGGGLNRFIPPQHQDERVRFFCCSTNPEHSKSLSHNIVTAIYADRSGVLWVGTEGGGLNKFTHKSETFPHYQPFCVQQERQAHSVVLSLYEDRTGVLWIGTQGSGLIQFDRNANRCKQYRADPDDPTQLGSDTIVSLLEDRQRNLWIGTRGGGLHRFDRDTGRFTRYRRDPDAPNSISSNSIRAIYEDASGAIWIGTEDAGLNWFDPEIGQFIHYQHDCNNPTSLSSNAVWAIYEDRQATLWIGTDEGLHQFDRQNGRFRRYQANAHDPNSLRDHHIRAIHEDQTGNLWIATRGGGLHNFDRTSETFRSYGQYEGLLSDVIYGILEDEHGKLWLSTNTRGLAVFDPRTGTARHYGTRDGLQSENFSVGAYHQSRNGEMFFGGINGFNAFYPDRLGKSPYPPPIIFTDLRISYTPVGIGGDSPLQQAITVTKTLRVSYLENTVTFEFAALDYTMPEKNRYAYMLEGFDATWIDAGAQRTVTYTNVPPGQYVFRVKGSNSDGVWNNEAATLTLMITPPFWDTGWFRLFAGVLIFALVIGGAGLRIKRIERQKRVLEQQVCERTFELERQKTQLQASEQRYRAIVEDQTELICRFLPDGTLTFVNDAYCRYFAKTRAELLGKPFFQFVPTDEQDAVRRHIAALTIQTPLLTNENHVMTPDGTLRWMQWTDRALFDEHGQLIEFQAVGRDVTDQKRLEEDLSRAKEVAEAANQAKSAFLANMSHELRSPLTAVLGFTQILADHPNRPLEEQKILNIIQRSGNHLLTLINQVLDLSKIEAGRITLNECTFDLHRLLDDLKDMFSLRARQKGLHLQFEQDERLPHFLRTDEVKLRQVLINLLNNAIKFTAEGGVVVRVAQASDVSDPSDMSETPKQARLKFEIEDTGPGIAPEELEQVFEAFTQTETGRQAQEGTGLGLPISRKFVQLMGGDMTVASDVGRGTRVRFDIQAAVVDDSEVERSSRPRRAIALEPGQPRYRLLIVDDKPDNRTLLLTLLTPYGFELREAANGQEALAIWHEWKPHLLWMDLRLPIMGGYEAIHTIRNEELRMRNETVGNSEDHLPPIIIIAVSASSAEDERAIALSNGCDDFLRKPFHETEIFDLMQRHLGVQFVYEEGEWQKVKGERKKPEETLTTALAALPSDVLNRLEQAITLCEINTIVQVIADIRSYAPSLADALTDLVEEFEYATILTAIQESHTVSF